MSEKRKIVHVTVAPAGLFYIPSFLSASEEHELLEHIQVEPFKPYDYHGFLAKREIVFFGSQGGYKGRNDEDTAPVPDWLRPLRNRCANLIALDAEELEMALVAHYPVGAAIGWHRDAPQFGPTVIGVSFNSDAPMRFRRFVDDVEELFSINLEHGSAYIMSGESRSVWQHGMTPTKSLRYSITFRTVKRSDRNRFPDERHEPKSIAQHLSKLEIRHVSPQRIGGRNKQLNQLKLFETGGR